MNIRDLIDKKVVIRSIEYPSFQLIVGILVDSVADFEQLEYNVRDDENDKKFHFNLSVIKERIGYTLFI